MGRLENRKKKAAALMSALAATRAKYDALGIPLKMVVDNDCWHLETVRDKDSTDEIIDELHDVSMGDLDMGPEELAICLAIGALGIDAERP